MNTPTTDRLRNYHCCVTMRDVDAWSEMGGLCRKLESALRGVMETPHFHDMPDEVQAQVVSALEDKTSHTGADFDTGDKDPYRPNP